MKFSSWLAAGSLVLVPLSVLAPLSASAAAPRAERATKADREPWEIPASAKLLTNPVIPDEVGLRAGKALWRAHCQTCHGTQGKGDGPNARLHEMRKSVAPRDLTDPEIQALADGEIFWRITNGYVDGDNVIMPAYARKIPTEGQRWLVVNYVRALGKAAPKK